MVEEKLILVKDLSKRYNKASENSLKNINFSIYKGEKFGILGPNGAGKTTLISILCGIIRASSGTYMFYNNYNELPFPEIKMNISFVPQDYAFYEELSPLQNMLYFGALYNISKNEILKRSDEIFNALSISDISKKTIKTFSGGVKRRVNLAIGLLSKPSVLFLDEPTVGADVQSKYAMLKYLNMLNSTGTTIIYSSHHMSEAETFCHRIAFIDKGKLVACDYINNLIDDYKAPDLKSLFIKLTCESSFV